MDVNHAGRLPFTVVVPTLNEEATLDEVLTEVARYADEVIVIDGHSTDRTPEVARRHGVRFLLDEGRGKGCAVRMGLRVAAHPIVVFVDADGSHEPRDIPRLVQPIRDGEADLVIGSRMTGGSDELSSDVYEFVRLAGSMIINLCINYRWRVRLSDTQNGFRAILRDVGSALELRADGTTVEQEMAMKALGHGYRVVNVPSHEFRRKGGHSKVDVKRVWPAYVWNIVANVLRPSKARRGGGAR